MNLPMKGLEYLIKITDQPAFLHITVIDLFYNLEIFSEFFHLNYFYFHISQNCNLMMDLFFYLFAWKYLNWHFYLVFNYLFSNFCTCYFYNINPFHFIYNQICDRINNIYSGESFVLMITLMLLYIIFLISQSIFLQYILSHLYPYCPV